MTLEINLFRTRVMSRIVMAMSPKNQQFERFIPEICFLYFQGISMTITESVNTAQNFVQLPVRVTP